VVIGGTVFDQKAAQTVLQDENGFRLAERNASTHRDQRLGEASKMLPLDHGIREQGGHGLGVDKIILIENFPSLAVACITTSEK
jgi:hypothetical protein